MSIISKNVPSESDLNGMILSFEQEHRLRATEREEATHRGEHVLDFNPPPFKFDPLFHILILGPVTWYLKGGIRGQVILDDGEFQ